MKSIFSKIKKGFREKRGVTILVASLVASILLAIGLSIFNTTVKDLVFAISGNQSSIAFYAADTAAECALFWDYQGAFATSSESDASLLSRGKGRYCNGQDITQDPSTFPAPYNNDPKYANNWNVKTSIPKSAETTFYLFPNATNKICATVIVTKTDGGAGSTNTVINSYGHNSCDPNNKRVVERGVQLGY